MMKRTIILMLLTLGMFCSAVGQENPEPYLGTWIGSIQRKYKDSAEFHSTPVIWRIHKILQGGLNKVFMTQIVNPADPKSIQTDTLNTACELSPGWMFLRFEDATNHCEATVGFRLQTVGGQVYLSGSTDLVKDGCFVIKVSLKKKDNDVSDILTPRHSPGKILPETKPESVATKKKVTSPAKVKPRLAAGDEYDFDDFPVVLPGDKPIKSEVLAVPAGGGTTPDELGRMVLNAIKQNNLKLWLSCGFHSSEDGFYAKRLAKFRTELLEDGLTDWNKIVFSRVVFTRSKSITPGEIDVNNYKIEFTYSDFLGIIGSMTLTKPANGKKYLVWHPGGRASLLRVAKN